MTKKCVLKIDINSLIKLFTSVDDFTYSKLMYKKQNCTQIEKLEFNILFVCPMIILQLVILRCCDIFKEIQEGT
ncbi:hypothetical protein FDP56_07825 [Enterococcus casseliflavus]|nr:hypothetical protein [Enterococcus casseliflavus]